MRYHSRVPIVLLLAGLLASLWTAGRRVAVERAAGTVELTVDMEQLRALTQSVGVPLPDALDALKRAGVTSIAVGEQTLGELETDGLVRVEHATAGLPPGESLVRIADAALYRRVTDNLRLKLRSTPAAGAAETGGGQRQEVGKAIPPAAGSGSHRSDRLIASPARRVLILGPGNLELSLAAGWNTVRGVMIGLPAEDVARVRDHGLAVVGRVTNFPAADDVAIPEVARRLRQAGAHTVIFAGDEVLGYRARVKEAAAALDAEGLRYGSVEFGKQLGDEELSKALQARIVRVHSIQGAELAKLDTDGVIDRFVKAAEERNIRLLYLRVITYLPFQDNIDYITAVAGGLRERGLRLGIAEPLERVYSETRSSPAALLAPPAAEAGRGGLVARLLARVAPAVSALAVAGAAVLLLAGLVVLPAAAQTRLALLAAAAAGLVVLGGGNLGREMVALVGAMLFPVLAFVWFPVAADEPYGSPAGRSENGSPPRITYHASPGTRPSSPYLQFAAISAVSVMGALTVVGLLSERDFMVKVAAFMGIKAAHFLPLLAVALLYAADAFGGPRPWPEVRRRARQNLGQILGERLQLWHLVVGGLAIVVVGLLLARTGNDPGVGVSGTEMRLRNLLDRYLVRPRTKEFLIGHPALLATLLLSAGCRGSAAIGWTKQRWVFIPFAVVGAIGQVSMVNSFCHLHTPLLMTVMRTFNGLWLGVLAGLLLARLVGRWLPASPAPPLGAPSSSLAAAGAPR